MIAKWFNNDSIEYIIASAYATGKGRWFGMFFGWRECHKNESKIILSKHDWEEVNDLIEYYNKFVKKS